MDAFGTVVKGQFYEIAHWTLELAQESLNCSMGEDANVFTSFEESGIAPFDQVVLYALSDTKCSLKFIPHSRNRSSVFVTPIECVVTLSGCPPNYKLNPVFGSSYLSRYDTCVYGEPLQFSFE